MNSFNLCTDFSNSISTIIEDDIPFVAKGKRGSRANVPAVFDIEVSSFYNEDNEKRATMYAWVFGINGKCVRGRHWWEFIDVLKAVKRRYNLDSDRRVIIYVHNLAYEFQFMRKLFHWKKVFAVENRKPLYAITEDGFEFRCSYLLSGYSLAVLGENLTKYKVKKMVGDLDYNLIRNSYTPLTEKEWGYILHDGLVVMAHIQEEIERLGDITKLPLTKTGYVRDLCRANCFKGDNNFQFIRLIKKSVLSPDDYVQLKRTYMGGFTHANINYVGKLLTNVSSYDFTSSYPTVMVSEKFPMGKAQRVKVYKDGEDFRKCLHKYCCMFDATFHNIRSKVSFENYISLSRTTNCDGFIVNNGRVVEAETLIIGLTEQDFEIIEQMYEWDSLEISSFKVWRKAYLPKDLILSVLTLYKNKTELKGVEGKEVEYLVSKGMINSTYGMCVTDICKDESLYDDEWHTEKADLVTLINRYNTNNQRFLFYPWGVWITAYARRNLFDGILEFQDDYIYSDTDSIKVLNAEAHKKYFELYNAKVTAKINACLDYYKIPRDMSHPKTIKGKEKPLGVWDYEGTYTRFKTLGAKRYMVEHDGSIAITIAGVSKKAGLEYLKHKYGSNENIFDHFVEDLYFPPHYDKDGVDANGSGKLCHTYIDTEMKGYCVDYTGKSAPYYEFSGIHMENTDYTLGLEAGFIKIIQGIQEGHII